MPQVIGEVSKAASTDNYFVVADTSLGGGYQVVADLVERDGIVTNARKSGMLVYCQSDGQIYQLGAGLTNLDWSLFTVSGGLTPTAIQTANYTANANELVLCDTSGGGFTLTLPATPTNGMKVGLLDVTNSFSDVNPLTIDPGTNEILNVVDTLQITIGRSAITFLCVDNGGVLGWHILDSIPTTGVGGEVINEVYASALKTSSTVYSAGQIINFDTIESDTQSTITTGAGWRFTAPDDGLYIVTGFFGTGSSANRWADTYLNGTFKERIIYTQSNNAANFAFTLDLNTGDYFDLRAESSSTTISGSASDGQRSAIRIVKASHVVNNITNNANLSYSTTEIDTGRKYTDGKTIYQKTISIPNTYTANVYSLSSGIGAGVVDTMIRAEMRMHDAGNIFLYSTSFQYLYFNNSTGNFSYSQSASGFTGPLEIDMWYTKV